VTKAAVAAELLVDLGDVIGCQVEEDEAQRDPTDPHPPADLMSAKADDQKQRRDCGPEHRRVPDRDVGLAVEIEPSAEFLEGQGESGRLSLDQVGQVQERVSVLEGVIVAPLNRIQERIDSAHDR
jgi:hypothetical protein